MKYPGEFVVKENIEITGSVILRFGETVDVFIGFPESAYDTSLAHGALHIHRILDPEEDCEGYEYSDSSPTIKIINDISFTETSFSNGAMGLSDEEKQYNTKYKGICYQIYKVIVTRHYYQEVGASWMDPKEVEQKLDQILSTFKFLDQKQGELKSADSQTPVAGICGSVSEDEIVTVIFGKDNVPAPRCMKVTPNQRLKIINNSDKIINGDVGQYKIDVTPGKSQTIDATFGSYLAPGVHIFPGGAAIWLQ